MTNIKFNRWVLDLPEYIPGRTMEEIKEKYGLKEVYKLASNENILGPAPEVLEYLKSDFQDINYYPDSYCVEIREKIGAHLGVAIENIIMGNGTDQIIEMICDAVLDSQKNIVISDPTFLTYEKSALKCNAIVKKVPLKDYRQDMESVLNAVDPDTAAVFLTSPHNPTGTIIAKEELDHFLRAVDPDVLVVIDEAYYEYIADEEKNNTLEYLNQYKNVILLRTFSKIYGLAGLRIGYGIADESLISSINKLSQPFNVNSIAQKAALIALKNQLYVKESMEKINAEKLKFYALFDQNNIRYIQSYANFILIEVGEHAQNIVEDLLKNGFIVRLGDFLGVQGFIRVSVSTPKINDEFLKLFINLNSQYSI